jgi:hypothetical protein
LGLRGFNYVLYGNAKERMMSLKDRVSDAGVTERLRKGQEREDGIWADESTMVGGGRRDISENRTGITLGRML